VKTIVRGKNVEVPDRVRDYAERKLRRLERMLDDRSDAIVELSNEQHRSAADAHIAEVTLVIDGQTLRSHATGSSYQAALDNVVDKVERRAVDYREKPRLRARPIEERQLLRRIADGTAGPARERRIVKTKRFAIEPMFEEDAISAMEELGHDFFVYVSAETEQVAILYERDDGDYGVIEPVIGGEYTKGKGRRNGGG
jgi:putative sigma-54 modulation protein